MLIVFLQAAAKGIFDYDSDFINAARNRDLEKVKAILAAGSVYKDFINAPDYVGVEVIEIGGPLGADMWVWGS